MVFKANLGNFTGYLPTSPDGLYIEDTGIVGQLTTPGYRPANVQKLKKFGGAKRLTPLTPSEKYQATQAAKKQYQREVLKDLREDKYRDVQSKNPSRSAINSLVKKSAR